MQAYLERLLPHACQRPLLALAPGPVGQRSAGL